jgi:hypothetical protein
MMAEDASVDSWIRLATANRDQGIASFNHEMERHARLRALPVPPIVPQAKATTFMEEAGRFMRSVAKDGGDDEA